MNVFDYMKAYYAVVRNDKFDKYFNLFLLVVISFFVLSLFDIPLIDKLNIDIDNFTNKNGYFYFWSFVFLPMFLLLFLSLFQRYHSEKIAFEKKHEFVSGLIYLKNIKDRMPWFIYGLIWNLIATGIFLCLWSQRDLIQSTFIEFLDSQGLIGWQDWFGVVFLITVCAASLSSVPSLFSWCFSCVLGYFIGVNPGFLYPVLLPVSLYFYNEAVISRMNQDFIENNIAVEKRSPSDTY